MQYVFTMTVFFQYDTLTWPEVAALPRDIPLILPLGEGYALDRSGLCPWESRCGLDYSRLFLSVGKAAVWLCRKPCLALISPTCWTACAMMVSHGCYALTPQGIDLGLGASRCSPEGQSHTLLHPKHPNSDHESQSNQDFIQPPRFRARQSRFTSYRPHRTTWLPFAPLCGYADHRSHRAGYCLSRL